MLQTSIYWRQALVSFLDSENPSAASSAVKACEEVVYQDEVQLAAELICIYLHGSFFMPFL